MGCERARSRPGVGDGCHRPRRGRADHRRQKPRLVREEDPSDQVFPVEKVTRVDLDGNLAKRRAIFTDEAHTPRAAEATLQDVLDDLTPLLPPAAREEECVRVLEVDWDDQEDRFKPWRSVVAESWNETFKDWPIEGPSASLALAKHIASQQ